MTYHPVPTMPFLVGPDKASETKRYTRGVKVTNQAPGSQLCEQYPDLKAAADAVIKDTGSLKTAMDACSTAAAAFKAARTALSSAVVQWDGTYNVFITTGEKYARTANDVASIGGEPRGKTIYPLAMPLSVDFTWNRQMDQLRVHVRRAPGMRMITVQLSPSPITPESWYELDGSGAVHIVPSPAKGTWWARAQSRTAKGKSEFTSPVSVIVT